MNKHWGDTVQETHPNEVIKPENGGTDFSLRPCPTLKHSNSRNDNKTCKNKSMKV